jgi:tetratricopeptide (TPR) repeat protein
MTVRYFELLSQKSPAGLFREVEDEAEYRLEYLDRDAQWVVDNDLARYVLRGEPGAREITAAEARLRVAQRAHPPPQAGEQSGSADRDEAADAHLEIGRACMDMGLLDEAIDEFRAAAQSAETECAAHTMIGLCFLEQGAHMAAIETFKRALSAERRSVLQEVVLYRRIGDAYDRYGDVDAARRYREKAAKQDVGASRGAPTTKDGGEITGGGRSS